MERILNIFGSFLNNIYDNPVPTIILLIIIIYVTNKILKLSGVYSLGKKIKEKLSETDEHKTITQAERMKRFEAEKEFMRKHPNVKC